MQIYIMLLVPFITELDSLQHPNSCSGDLVQLPLTSVVGMAVSPVLKQCLSLVIHSGSMRQQTLQLIGSTEGRKKNQKSEQKIHS